MTMGRLPSFGGTASHASQKSVRFPADVMHHRAMQNLVAISRAREHHEVEIYGLQPQVGPGQKCTCISAQVLMTNKLVVVDAQTEDGQ